MMTAETLSHKPMLSELLAGSVVVKPVDDREIKGITLDSRTVREGDLFLACAGSQTHGLTHAMQAARQGAVAIVWENDGETAPDEVLRTGYPNLFMAGVSELSQSAGVIASRFYGAPSSDMNIIGVTGTNGKTSCSHFLAQALSHDTPGAITGTLGNGLFGSLEAATHTTPDAVTLQSLLSQFRDEGAQYVVMEVSSHGLDQGRVSSVDYDIAVFTNLSRDHLDYHESMDKYGRAKCRLFEMPTLQYAIINGDDDFGSTLMAATGHDCECVSYGFNDNAVLADHMVRASMLTTGLAGIRFHVETPWGKGWLESPLMGQFNASNLLAVLSTLLVMDFDFDDAVARVQKCKTIAGRMERVGGPEARPCVIVDYAHTPDALENALRALRDHMPKSDKRKKDNYGRCSLWCIFGCGGDRDRGKRAEMGAIAERIADEVVVTNDNPRTEDAKTIVADILAGMKKPENASVIPDRSQALETIIAQAGPEDIVFIAGKGHEQYQDIDGGKIPWAGDAKVARAALAAAEGSAR